MAQLNNTIINGSLRTVGEVNASSHIYLTGANASNSTSNTSQIVFGTKSDNHVALSSNSNNLIINPTSSTTQGQIQLKVGSTPSIMIGSDKVATESYVSTAISTAITNALNSNY